MARYRKGESGNPAGRPTGRQNRTTEELKAAVMAFLDGNLSGLQKDFQKLKPVDRMKVMVALLKFVLPTAREVDLSLGIQHLSDHQIDEIVRKITKQ